MESLKINTGVISLKVVGDDGEERGIFKFNPEDVVVANRVLQLLEEYEVKEKEFEDKASKCDTDSQKAELLCEICAYFKSSIDTCFGEGSSAVLFGDANTLSMFGDFFDGIMPYYKKARTAKIKKYDKYKKSEK